MEVKEKIEDIKRIEEFFTLFNRKISKRIFSKSSKEKINVPQFHILKVLQEDGECTMSHLAERLYITTSATTNLVTKLLKSGLINRSHSLKDRRIILIEINKRGKEIVERAWNQICGFFNSLLANLSLKERREWQKVWKKIHYFLVREDEKK